VANGSADGSREGTFVLSPSLVITGKLKGGDASMNDRCLIHSQPLPCAYCESEKRMSTWRAAHSTITRGIFVCDMNPYLLGGIAGILLIIIGLLAGGGKMKKEQKVNRIDLDEFQKFGYLQEVNRQFLHPLGLALEVIVDDDGKVDRLGGIWDYRNDPEGMAFCDLSTKEASEKADRVEAERKRFQKSREERLGFTIQPIGHKLDKD
jgi:hypothetical protein